MSHVTEPELLKLASLHSDGEVEAEFLRVEIELQAGLFPQLGHDPGHLRHVQAWIDGTDVS